MSDEINRDINGMPEVVYPILKIYFGQETETGKTPLLLFDVVPRDSYLEDQGEIGSGSPDEENPYYISGNVLSPLVLNANGNLFWDKNGRLIKGSCLYNTSVKNHRNEAETMIAAYSDAYLPAYAESSADDNVESIGKHIGNIPNKYNSTLTILAGGEIPEGGGSVGHSESDIIWFNDEQFEALAGYYGNVAGYDSSGGVVLGDNIPGSHGPLLQITGLSADCIKRGVKYFGIMGTFAGTLGPLTTKSYIDSNHTLTPTGTGYDGWNEVTTTQVKVAKTPSAPYTYYIGEIKPT